MTQTPGPDPAEPLGRSPLGLRLGLILRALRHRNYRLFFGGQLVSLTGTWMQSVAQAWLVYRLTGSAVLLGAIGFAGQIPVFLFAPLGGAVADRHPRRRILIVTQAAAMLLAFTLALLTLSHRVRVWQVACLAALLGVVNAFDAPTRQSFVVDMVGRDDLANAIALNSSLFNGARIIGPALAGLLVATIGEGWCFLANAVSYLAVLAGLLLMRVPEGRPRPSSGSVLGHIVEGFRFVRHTRPILALLLLLGLVSLMGVPYIVLMPIFAHKVLHGGARELGVLMGTTGVGALAAAVGLAARRNVFGLGTYVAWATAGLGVSLVAFAASRTFWLSVALLLPTAFCMMVEMAASNTLIQAMVPDALRGRVMAAYLMMFMGMAPFGSLLAGAVADRLGAPTTVTMGGLGCLGGALLFALRLPYLRPEGRQLIQARQTGGDSI